MIQKSLLFNIAILPILSVLVYFFLFSSIVVQGYSLDILEEVTMANQMWKDPEVLTHLSDTAKYELSFVGGTLKDLEAYIKKEYSPFRFLIYLQGALYLFYLSLIGGYLFQKSAKR